MRLETFVDIMGISIIQVIDRIQQQEVPSNPPFSPDDFFNVDWPKSLSKIECDGKNELQSGSVIIDLCNDFINSNSFELHTVETNTMHFNVSCDSEGAYLREQSMKNNQSANFLHAPKKISMKEESHTELLLSETVASHSAMNAKMTPSQLWRRPNPLRLAAFKDFVKDSVRSYSDAVKILERGMRTLSKAGQVEKQSLEEDNTSELFLELLPLHISLYKKHSA